MKSLSPRYTASTLPRPELQARQADSGAAR